MKYDIFISYKYSDNFGNITPDYQIAKELYNFLLEHGFSIFFSNESLKNLGSSRYKNDIDEALDSAKILIVILTKVEYATSEWVQYEWDSFFNDILSGIKKMANSLHLQKILPYLLSRGH